MISAGEDGTTDAPEGAAAVAEDGISGTDPVGAPPLAGTLADTAAVFGRLGALNRESLALAAELAWTVAGDPEITPDRKDWRFAEGLRFDPVTGLQLERYDSKNPDRALRAGGGLTAARSGAPAAQRATPPSHVGSSGAPGRPCPAAAVCRRRGRLPRPGQAEGFHYAGGLGVLPTGQPEVP